MKIYQVPRISIFINYFTAIVIIILSYQFYEFYGNLIAIFISFFIPSIAVFLYAMYLTRCHIDINEEGISLPDKYIWIKHLTWNEVESIQYQKRLFLKPIIYLTFRADNKENKLKEPFIVGQYSAIIRDLYFYKLLTVPEAAEKY